MIKRKQESVVKKSAKQFPIVGIVGPRQSGKTTLAQTTFKNYQYVSLEDLDMRDFATRDPRKFLETYSGNVIFDEIQNTPELFSYIQSHTDKAKIPGQYILTGSQHFSMMESISQTLAGRIALHTLLPLSLDEFNKGETSSESYVKYLFTGCYPRIYDQNIDPQQFYSNYIQTYIERDVRNIKNVTNLTTFQRFVKLCAGRVGQLLNLSSLANDVGITHNTAASWISLLEASFIVYLHKPYYKNFNKRVTKSPKLYFYDTGLAVSLLGVESEKQLSTHHLIGSLFENMVISEYLKFRFNEGKQNNAYFWRDKTGREIDLLIENERKLYSIEIKSGKTISSDYFSNLNYWQALTGNTSDTSYVLYGGNEKQKRSEATVFNWINMTKLFKTVSEKR